MNDILLPRTDAGVVIQVIIATVAFAGLTWLLRKRPEWRLLSIGLWICAYAAMGLRSLH